MSHAIARISLKGRDQSAASQLVDLDDSTVLEAGEGRPGLAAVYLAVNVLGGLLAALAGYVLGRALT